MVKRYKKGARAERELAKILKEKGFSVVRSAGSGSNISTPDLVAIKRRNVFAFECKAWKRLPKLKEEEYKEFSRWCKNAGASGFLAWKNRKWLFLDLNDINKKNIKVCGLTLDELLRIMEGKIHENNNRVRHS